MFWVPAFNHFISLTKEINLLRSHIEACSNGLSSLQEAEIILSILIEHELTHGTVCRKKHIERFIRGQPKDIVLSFSTMTMRRLESD